VHGAIQHVAIADNCFEAERSITDRTHSAPGSIADVGRLLLWVSAVRWRHPWHCLQLLRSRAFDHGSNPHGARVDCWRVSAADVGQCCAL